MNTLKNDNGPIVKKLLPDKKTKFEAFYPQLFLRLRNSFEISEEEHLAALGVSSFFLRLFLFANYAPYGQTVTGKLFYSADEKFLIQEISKGDFDAIVKLLEPYKKYILQKHTSFLPRITGLYKLFNEDRYFITHKNFFGLSKDVKYQFLWNPNALSSKQFNLGFVRKADLLDQIEQDVIFLKNNSVSNYDLLVRIHHLDPDVKTAIITRPKVASISDFSEMKGSRKLQPTNSEPNIFISELASNHSMYPFENGIIAGDELYFIGIVNISQIDEKKGLKKENESYHKRFLRMVHERFC